MTDFVTRFCADCGGEYQQHPVYAAYNIGLGRCTACYAAWYGKLPHPRSLSIIGNDWHWRHERQLALRLEAAL